MNPGPFLERTGPTLGPDPTRVLLRPFFPTNRQLALNILERIATLSPAQVTSELSQILASFGHRHEHLTERFRIRFDEVQKFVSSQWEFSPEGEALVGAYFSSEYALEAAALFNPSMVPHPDQTNLDPGCLRFILSLRATGEGHLSSVVFRSGIVNAHHDIGLDPPTTPMRDPLPEADAVYRKSGDVTYHRRHGDEEEGEYHWDDVAFDPHSDLAGRVLFPMGARRSRGIEDARFVLFQEPGEPPVYYATYTAFDGRQALPQLLETKDFLRFRFWNLEGAGVLNKGMALFPRKVDGQFMMLSRQDDENVLWMKSATLVHWEDPQVLLRPREPWEFTKMGNCGSPLETDAGWLVLTHGVGALRRYCLGAALLDREDPTKVLARLKQPLLFPLESEREGYVPNVVYSCGALIHGPSLIVPYARSDTSSGFFRVNLAELLAAMVRVPQKSGS